MIKIVIVDDHLIVRRGFREMANEEMSFNVVHEASSGEALIDYLRNNTCDVVLLDISLPGKNGIDVLRHIRERYAHIKVLIVSGYPEERYALPMIKNGANGYICKDCEQEELIRAIRLVAAGRRYLSPKTSELLANEVFSDHDKDPHHSLSERELQVFIRLSEGASVSDIADVLNLSVKTISTYRTRLKEKMALGSNAEMAAYAIRHGLIGGQSELQNET
jgi:DNA-binding NarL/FixJ family response regulator